MREQVKGQTAAVVVFGLIALVIITAILGGAVTIVQVSGDLQHATTQLNDIREADAKAEQARVKSRAATAATLASLQRHARQQTATERAQRRYLALMARELRSHGIPVPPPPRVTVTASPKGPRPHRANPGHTAHGPRSPTASPTCLLVPPLCGLPLGLPTLLP